MNSNNTFVMPPEDKRYGLYSVIHEATTFDKAVVQENYPFGSGLKCIQRTWIETATKGKGKGQQRIGHCTTKKEFNRAYTALLNEGHKLENNNQLLRMSLNEAFYNKVKYSTFRDMIILFFAPQPDGREFVRHFSLNAYYGPAELLALQIISGVDFDGLSGYQRERMEFIINARLRAYGAEYNKKEHDEWMAKPEAWRYQKALTYIGENHGLSDITN